jgi:hypothetical protein
MKHLKDNTMQTTHEEDVNQASVSTNLTNGTVDLGAQNLEEDFHGSNRDGHAAVLVELLWRFSPLSSEEPEELMNLFVRLDEIHKLGLVNDSIFIARILPLVSGSVLVFLGGCLHDGSDWVECKE